MIDKILWSNHAFIRLHQRGILKEDVENIIKNPIQIIRQPDNKLKCFGIIPNPENELIKYLVVVYIEYMTKDTVKVLTVMLKDKGGLKYDGFSL